MFDTVVLGRSCPKAEYERYAQRLRVKLFDAQRTCIEKGIPLLVIVSGVDGSGRGEIMNLLSEWMDGKFLKSYFFWEETEDQRERPMEWRFWRCLPGNGETHIFYDGWYGYLMRLMCAGEIGEKDYMTRLAEFKGLEESLALSGMAIVKIWLHLDKKAHDKRLKRRMENKAERHFTPVDKKTSGSYEALVNAAAEAVTATDRTYAPWIVVDAEDDNFRNLSVARAIVDTVERALATRRAREAADEAEKEFAGREVKEAEKEIAADMAAASTDKSAKAPADSSAAAADGKGEDGNIPTVPVPALGDPAALVPVPRTGFLADIPLTTLEAIDLTPTVDRDVYKKEVKKLQEELRDLTYRAYRKHISSTILFEGMDAAGKGGTIRRLLQGVDCRIASVIPISSPTDEELAHHYLWRFWRHIPRAGFVTIYDRSWYGRVLVERVERLTPVRDWSRAYAEMNHFEHQLCKNGNILLKFWLHISKDEELRRFKDRENTPWKRYKITPDDWRNRGKWDQYLVAADEMFLRTSTGYAPWHILSAEDKKYARLEALRIWRDALKKALGDK